MKTYFRVICLDASNKPNDIPNSKWVKKDEIYTVIRVVKLPLQNMAMGYELEEIDLKDCFPYQFFSSNRFGILLKDDEWAEEVLSEILECAKEEAQLVSDLA